MAQELQFNYVPTVAPTSIEGLPRWVEAELRRIGGLLGAATVLKVDELNEAPVKPLEGMVVLADGTNWDPGSGAGFYGYYGGAWNKLG
jgi:hypothetical protein